jgi:hypothetical protein
MSKRKVKVHFDATKPNDVGHTALCGFPQVDTEVDVTKVTCELCLRLLRARARPANDNAAPKSSKKKGKPLTKSEFAAEVDAPGLRRKRHKAGPPPRFAAPTWGSKCPFEWKADGRYAPVTRHCGNCPVCAHERDMAQAIEESHRRKVHTLRRPERAPKWDSLNAALVALVEHETHERTSPSAFGFMLARCERGDLMTDNGSSRPDDPQMLRADDLVHVRQALSVAYPEGAHPMLTARQCMTVLIARTPGAMAIVRGRRANETDDKAPGPIVEIPYEDLAERLSVSIGDLKALVKEGRRRATVELAARGLIPAPPASAGLAEAVWERGKRVANG